MTEADILAAKSPYALFGDVSEVQLRAEFKKLCRVAHPDHGGSDNAFAHLNSLFHTGLEQLSNGTYGDTTNINQYQMSNEPLFNGDVSTLHYATVYNDEPVLIKIPRNARNGNLLLDEKRAIEKVRSDLPELHAFFPAPQETLKLRDASGNGKLCVVYNYTPGFHTLEEVEKVYPAGISGRDVAWIFRRLLTALGGLYDTDLVHGGITPANVLIHAQWHGLIVLDFKAARKPGAEIPFRSKAFKDLYPPDTDMMSTAVDVHMAAMCMERLLRDKAPRQLRAFFNGCKINVPTPHPNKLLNEFDKLLYTVYGPPKFHRFSMPDRT